MMMEKVKAEDYNDYKQIALIDYVSPSLEFELFKTLSNVGYYLLLFPYKIIFDHRRKTFKVVTFRFQQILCAILQLLTIFYCCVELRNPELKSMREDPRMMFTYFIIISQVITTSVIFSNGWFRRNSILALVDSLQTSKKTIQGVVFTALSSKFQARLICLLLFVPGFIFLFATKHRNRKGVDIYRDTAIEARFAFGFLGLRSNLTNEDLWKPATLILTPMYAISSLHRFNSVSMVDVILLFGSFIALKITKQFVEDIKHETSSILVIQKFKELKSTFVKINDAIGTPIFVLLFTVIPYYSSSLAESLEFKDVVENLLFLLYFVYYGAGLVMASEANRNANYMKIWICEKENIVDNNISKNTLQILLYDLNWNQVGIQGPGGILTITYGLLGTLMSLILTYSVIMVQLQSTNTNNGDFHSKNKM